MPLRCTPLVALGKYYQFPLAVPTGSMQLLRLTWDTPQDVRPGMYRLCCRMLVSDIYRLDWLDVAVLPLQQLATEQTTTRLLQQRFQLLAAAREWVSVDCGLIRVDNLTSLRVCMRNHDARTLKAGVAWDTVNLYRLAP